MLYQPLRLHLLLFFCLIFSGVAFAKDDPRIGLEPGNLLPSFKLPDLNDKPMALEEFRGRIIVIHLWKCQ
jgi:hypothetical protein